jgi:RND superfamily putative drug exporter
VVFVVVAIYVVLFFMFRSLILPLKAIAMNSLLSILASCGALVVVFQDALGADLLRFRPLGFVAPSLPIVLSCVLFGLSVEYEVCLLSQVEEAHDGVQTPVASTTRRLDSLD